jgi:predicted metal-dependent hydrolase
MLPVGEQFFIDSVREVAKRLGTAWNTQAPAHHHR